MPVITVLGIPANWKRDKIIPFWKDIRSCVEKLPELALEPEQVSVFFPTDHLSVGLGEEIIIFVDGLFEKPERTKRTINQYARILGRTAKQYFQDALVEVFIRQTNAGKGFWSSRIK